MPAAAVVFVREVKARTEGDPRVVALREQLAGAADGPAGPLRGSLRETYDAVHAEKLGEVAAEFDRIHSIQRALAVGSVDEIIPATGLRPYIVDALERGMAQTGRRSQLCTGSAAASAGGSSMDTGGEAGAS